MSDILRQPDVLDVLRQPPAALPPGARNNAQIAHDKMLEEILSEVGSMLAKHYDKQAVADVLNTLATEFRGARITGFLPILIFKKASRALAATPAALPVLPVQPAAPGAPNNGTDAAPAGKLDFLRFEFKYVLPKDLRACIEKDIEPFMMLDPFVAEREDRNYLVRSLYYDDAAYSSYYQKIEGALLRSKFRLRTYSDTPRDNDRIYLEIKGRYNSLVFKRRTAFDSVTPFSECASVTDEIVRAAQGSPLGEQFVFALARRRIEPIMLIDYIRRPYVSRYDPEFRLTMDDHLYGTVTNRLFPDHWETRREFLVDCTVMEIKFRSSIPLWFHRIIKNYGLKRVSISKICRGMEACDLVPAVD